MDILIRGLNALLMVAMPLALGVVLARRLKVGWRLYAAGAATFIAAQALHLPFNRWALGTLFERLGLTGARAGWPLVGVAMLLGLSAGVFEEGARYLVYRFWLKDARTWNEALMFGAGHGGIEAIVLGGIAAAALLQAAALRGADLTTLVPAAQVDAARAQLAAYWSAPWYAALLGAVERAFALCLHLSMAVLVLQAFTRRNLVWMGAAIGWHALSDAVAVFAALTWGPYLTEGLIGLVAIASLGITWALRQPSAPALEPTSAVGPPAGQGASTEITPEGIDDSRYAP